MNSVKLFVLMLLIAISLLRCTYKEDSVYSIKEENLPKLGSTRIDVLDDSLVFSSSIVRTGRSSLLRYGHIWGDTPDLSFADGIFFNYSEVQFSGFQEEPFNFRTYATDMSIDKNSPMYVMPYAVNEAGISYGLVNEQSICSNLYFKEYQIIEEENGDGKISPGEIVKLKFWISNNSLINSVSPLITTVKKSSNYVISVTPFQNISVIPNVITNHLDGFFISEVQLASNATNPLVVEVFIRDNNCHLIPFKLLKRDGTDIFIKIN